MAKLHIRRKTLIIALAAVIALLASGYFWNVWHIRNLNNDPQFDPCDSNMIARFALNDSCTLISVSGQPVNFDMGSRHSFISRQSLDKLIGDGYPVTVSRVLVYTKDSDGRSHWYTHKATLDVALPNPELPDSVYFIRNVELLVSEVPGTSIFGMDLMQYMVLEHRYNTDEICIYRQVPDDGYITVSDITYHDSKLGDIFGRINRMSVTLAVNDDKPREYFFDTGGTMRRFEVVQPEKCLPSATGVTVRDSIYGYWTQKKCRVAFGNRMRYSTVVYADKLHTDEYSANPFNLFDQDFIIDFPGRKLMIRKTKN